MLFKGQLISTEFFCFFNSPLKRTKIFCPSRLGQKFSSSIFGSIEDTRITFRDELTFRLSIFFYYNFYKNKENFGFWTPANATKETFASEIYYREFRHYESFPFFVTQFFIQYGHSISTVPGMINSDLIYDYDYEIKLLY